MLVTGTLKCLHCGHISGEWVGRSGSPFLARGLRGRTGPACDPDSILRCSRCKGPLFLDDAVAVRTSARLQRIARLRRQIAEIEERRRARRTAA